MSTDQPVFGTVPGAARAAPLELWAGAECSMVRVRESYVDQNVLTGHDHRPEDIDRLAGLGARAVRFPVLWERTWPDETRAPDWTLVDARLQRLRALGIRPIVGLVHHGSGPSHTSLLQDSFVEGLARFAQRVAERYPWIEDYTPINEPLTTARFSALYGHWYPHATDTPSFLRALVVECQATRAAMRAIRAVVPQARLVQTEDLGTTFATPALAEQARYENERRFLSLDLLCGRVDRAHPLREHLRVEGLAEEALDSLVESPCPPDLIGLNHYVTSDRFLDEHLDKYPPHVHGGNGRQAYADVEAVRVLGAGLPGHGALLELLWDRYRIPLAITEAHLGCAPEDQVRWLVETWNGAQAAREAGVDVRAVTVWSVFGACDWDSLLTRPRGHYESGVYDVRGGAVRPTALASVARDLAQHGATGHPMANEPGWWRRGIRLQYPSHGPVVHARAPTTRRPVLVTGARGTLGVALRRMCEARGLRVVALERGQLDICDPRALDAALDAHRPWAVVNAAGYVRVDQAEGESDACLRGNAHGPALLARACAARGIRVAAFSSDLVFDGRKHAPYVESDAVSPLSVYGQSKVQLERDVLECCPEAMVVRTSAFFGPWDQANFVHAALEALRAGQPFEAADDALVSPTYVPDLADAVLTLLVDGAQGLWHLANPGALSWHELALRAAEAADVPVHGLRARTTASLGLRAPRPAYSVLGSERGGLMPPLEQALARFVEATAASGPVRERQARAGGEAR
jgi:dTDP-4-dehydrorhamnose reductase